MKIKVFKEFIGQKIKNIEIIKEDKFYPIIGNIGDYSSELIFTLENGKKYIFHHLQDCSENVYIEDISGDITKLIGKEILKFEERTENSSGIGWSEIYTFYDIETLNEHIQIRWCGESNGYYSEAVYFNELDDKNEIICNLKPYKKTVQQPLRFIDYNEAVLLNKVTLISNKIGTHKTSEVSVNMIKNQFKDRSDIRYINVDSTDLHPHQIESMINSKAPIFEIMSLEKLLKSNIKNCNVVTFRKDNKTIPKQTTVDNLFKFKNSIKDVEQYEVLFNCPDDYFEMKVKDFKINNEHKGGLK